MAYHQDKPKEAAQYFSAALKIAEDIDSEPSAWLAARTNLGHAFRRLRHFNRALIEFDEVLRQGGKDAAIFSAKGLILMEQNKPEEAVVVLHEALAISPQDSIATELLNKALEETALLDGAAESEAEDLAEFEHALGQRKMEASVKVNGRRGGGRGMMDKGKGRVRRSRRMTVLEDEEDEVVKGDSMMDMSDDE